jgi:hypothetical protein
MLSRLVGQIKLGGGHPDCQELGPEGREEV